MKEAFQTIRVALDVANLEITELQVDFNTTSAILDDTENDLEDMKADLHDAQTKMDHAKSNLEWEKFFNGLEAADARQEVAKTKLEAIGTRSTPVVKRRKM